jgi:hypothetical protein
MQMGVRALCGPWASTVAMNQMKTTPPKSYKFIAAKPCAPCPERRRPWTPAPPSAPPSASSLASISACMLPSMLGSVLGSCSLRVDELDVVPHAAMGL